MNSSRVMIMHGAYGHANENWFPWLKRKLEGRSILCHVPTFPTPVGQSLSAWLQCYCERYQALVTQDTILIGHSLGALFALHCLMSTQVKITALVLVGGFHQRVGHAQFDDLNQDFFDRAIDWDAIKANAQHRVLFHGLNDPYVDLSQAQYLAAVLSAQMILVSGAGHFNAQSGFLSFPLLWLYLSQSSWI